MVPQIRGIIMDSLLKLALIFASIAFVMYIAIWVYRRPQRKIAKEIEEGWKKNTL